MGDSSGHVIYLVILLAALGGWGLVEYRSRAGEGIRTLLAWGLIFMGLMAGYGLYQDSARALRPPLLVSGNSVQIPRAQDGHYYLHLDINGKAMIMLADTGASTIVLSPADARSLGIDTTNLAYLGSANTANGVVRTARVSLSLVEMGPFRDENVTAYVNESDMEGSLMGMEYLGQFVIKITQDQMILAR